MRPGCAILGAIIFWLIGTANGANQFVCLAIGALLGLALFQVTQAAFKPKPPTKQKRGKQPQFPIRVSGKCRGRRCRLSRTLLGQPASSISAFKL